MTHNHTGSIASYLGAAQQALAARSDAELTAVFESGERLGKGRIENCDPIDVVAYIVLLKEMNKRGLHPFDSKECQHDWYSSHLDDDIAQGAQPTL